MLNLFTLRKSYYANSVQLSVRNSSFERIREIDPILKRELPGIITYFRVNWVIM